MYGKDYNSVLADVWNGKDTWYGGHLIGLNDQLNGDRSHSAFRQTLDNYEKYNGYNDKKGSLAGAKGELEHSMNIGDTAEKEVVKEAYEKMATYGRTSRATISSCNITTSRPKSILG